MIVFFLLGRKRRVQRLWLLHIIVMYVTESFYSTTGANCISITIMDKSASRLEATTSPAGQ
jgi:hypothetical protein